MAAPPPPRFVADQAAGCELGLVAPKFQLPDSCGHMVPLCSFHGDIIRIKNSACWCGPCRGGELEAQERHEARADDITLMAAGWVIQEDATEEGLGVLA